MAAVSAPVALLTGDHYAVPVLVGMAAAGFGAGQVLLRRYRQANRGSTPLSMATVALAWLLTALFAAAVLYGLAVTAGARAGAARVYTDDWSALFEGMSGVTSTGLTMVTREGELPAIVQWWRTLLQWVGGVGVVVFGLALLNPGQDEAALYQAATRSDVQSTARRIGLLFVAMTAASIAAFAAVGMPLWEAINHGMTGIATGRVHRHQRPASPAIR